MRASQPRWSTSCSGKMQRLATERAAAQGLLTVFISIGQLVCGALIGAVATAQGGGSHGYRVAFAYTGVIVLVMMVFGYGLKKKPAAGMR